MAFVSAIDQVMTAIVGALKVPAMEALAPGGIYTGVPQGTALPYVRVDSASETRLDTMGRAGRTVTIQVHAFSDYRGPKRAMQIISKAVELLHYATLSVGGHTTLAVQYQTGLDAGDEVIDGQAVYHYVGMFDVLVQQT
jgi:hypothetical protein